MQMNNRHGSPELKREWEQYVKDVKAAAYGQWEPIVMEFAGSVLGHAISPNYKHVRCPFHNSQGDGFKLFNDFRMTGGAVCATCGAWSDGWKLLQKATGMSFTDLVKEVGRSFGLRWKYDRVDAPSRMINAIPPEQIAKPLDEEAIRRKDNWLANLMSQTWAESMGIMEPDAAPARAYLRNRAITSAIAPLDDLRYHPSLPFFENRVEIARYPAFLSLLTQPDGKPLTFQRIYITPEGLKAPVEKGKEKKLMGHRSTAQYNGSAVRLDHAVGSVLCVTEGVETGLAFRAMTGLPTWACCVAGLMETLMVPDSVKIVIVASDKDRSGRGKEAAMTLVTRLRASGRLAAEFAPPFAIPDESPKGIDWNDVLMRFGLEEAKKQTFVTGLRSQIESMLVGMGLSWDSAMPHEW